ncbi:hypothetical protein E6Q11_03455 [Candidatus Dojkabacteria bacterium]|uniref:DOD-type homing endonuclease domain-containing protein n=1 Tax=Candidatus Dojkabacteria bacterium TaxID=2099670 RepID=A0A5C7J7W7_9BACT|nr:MAG: hypothetical protein E6Q11_03455 [Candidatus Dojkabacteria bacterium]
MDRFEYTKNRISDGAPLRQIAKELGVGESTVFYWKQNNFTTGTRTISTTKEDIINICKSCAPYYVYILGCYLGDGCISQFPRTKKLEIFSGSAHPSIIDDQIRSLNILFNQNKVNSIKHPSYNMYTITVYNKSLDQYFPQHGQGKKHDRNILLTDWQTELVEEHTDCFIKGLIATDGCLFNASNRIKKDGSKTDLPSYQFTNKSMDIINLYTSSLDRLGIHYTKVHKKSGAVNVFTRDRKNVQKIFDIYESSQKKLT